MLLVMDALLQCTDHLLMPSPRNSPLRLFPCMTIQSTSNSTPTLSLVSHSILQHIQLTEHKINDLSTVSLAGMPKHVHISDPRDSLSTSNVMPTVAVGKMANSLIRTKGLRISLHDVQIQIIGCCSVE